MPARRVAILTDSLSIPRWAAQTIEELDASELVEVALFLLDAPRPRRVPLAYRLYEAADRRVFRAQPDALAPVELTPSTPVLELRPGGAAEQELLAARLDAILQVAGEPVDGPLLSCARHGVWSLRHGASRRAPFFWEMYEREPATRTDLVSHSADGRRSVYTSYSRTDRLSLNRARNRAYCKAAQFPLRALRDLDASEPAEAPDAERPVPGTAQVLALLVRVVAGFVGRKLRALVTREQWLIAYRRATGPPGASWPTRGAHFDLLVPPDDRYYADPLLFERDGAVHLFFEDYVHRDRKAVIAHTELPRDGGTRRPRTVLRAEHHLSYPFVFESDGDVFMVPESIAAGRIDLYRAVRFPDEWQLERTLLDGVRAVDATLLAHGGRFWMLACLAAPGTLAIDELFVFSAASLAGEWTPHPRNPVVSDVRRARPAGGLFVDGDGRLIRPSQDCSHRYGAAIVLNRVDTLSEDEYAETEIARVGPEWLPRGEATHTYSAAAGVEAFDGMRRAVRIGRLGRAASPA